MKRLALLFLLPLAASAEPGPITQYLMQEPATLFDVGMLRLERLTSEFRNRVAMNWSTRPDTGEPRRADVNVSYDEDDDRIYVGFLVMNSSASETEMEEICGSAFRNMGIWLGKSSTSLFSHAGRSDDAGAPDGFSTALTEMIVMRCYISSSTNSAEGRFWASQSLQDFIRQRPMQIGQWSTGE